MTYKTLLTYLPDDKQVPRLVDVALPLAERFGAHLVGLHVMPKVPMYGMVAIEAPRDFLAHQEAAMQAEAKTLRGIFESATKSAAATCEWRAEAANYNEIAEDVVHHALCSDIVIVSQEMEGELDRHRDLPASVVLGAGRPVLVVPTAGKFGAVGKRVTLAWNHTRESARAAFDALPLLADADSVMVLGINPPSESRKRAFSPTEDMALCLSRHGIKAEAATSVTDGISVGSELLSRLSDHGSDLLVMGCYGHSRIRETIFGGATREIFEHMTVPVLMSH